MRTLLALSLLSGVMVGQNVSPETTKWVSRNIDTLVVPQRLNTLTMSGDSGKHLSLKFTDSLYVFGDLPVSEGAKVFLKWLKDYYGISKEAWKEKKP